jgi:hypothetical protein
VNLSRAAVRLWFNRGEKRGHFIRREGSRLATSTCGIGGNSLSSSSLSSGRNYRESFGTRSSASLPIRSQQTFCPSTTRYSLLYEYDVADSKSPFFAYEFLRFWIMRYRRLVSLLPRRFSPSCTLNDWEWLTRRLRLVDTLIGALSKRPEVKNLTCVSNNAGVGKFGLGE